MTLHCPTVQARDFLCAIRLFSLLTKLLHSGSYATMFPASVSFLTDDVNLLYSLYFGIFDFIFDSLYADAIEGAQARAV